MPAPDPWRDPPEESTDLYPKLVVWDHRVSGSITLGQTRLPLWCFLPWAIEIGWDGILRQYPQIPEPDYDWDARQAAEFLHDLLEMRGEFARLLLVLADAERRSKTERDRNWWRSRKQRQRVSAQLRRCLAVLGETPLEPTEP